MIRGGFSQLIIIMAHDATSGLFIPCVYALMSSKRKEDYRQLFSYVVSQMVVNTLVGLQFVTTDFEDALMDAVRAEFHWVIIIGCYFHFLQAIRRQANAKVGDDATVTLLLEEMKQLTIIPQNLINERVEEMEQRFLSRSTTEKEARGIRAFFSYFRRWYVNGPFPPSTWNVERFIYGDKVAILYRTNSPLEGYNRHIVLRESEHFIRLNGKVC